MDRVSLKANEFTHVTDTNTSVTRLLTGPTTYTLSSNEQLVFTTPRNLICIPPRHFAVIENPVLRDEKTNAVLHDKHGNVRVGLGEKQVRLTQAPFALYAQESLSGVFPLRVLKSTEALVLRAVRSFRDGKAEMDRAVGDEYLFQGPGTYYPRGEEEVVSELQAIVVKPLESLRLRAKNAHVDVTGKSRSVGEEYLWSEEGAYMISVDEVLVDVQKAVILTAAKALHVEVSKAFKDPRPWANGAVRKPGELFLVTINETAAFVQQPSEKIVKEVPLLTVTHLQFAVILDPVVNGTPQLGRRKVVTNCSLFLQPGESLEGSVSPVYVLNQDEAIVLTALEEFDDTNTGNGEPNQVKRMPGDMWLLTGPRQYIPHSSVRVVPDKRSQLIRRRIVLAPGEGVYVRDTASGEVRAVIGGTIMLGAHEELWEKELPEVVEQRLAQQGASYLSYMESQQAAAPRDKTKVVRFVVPHNTVSQIYDYKKRTQRIVFGPDEVLLGPEEEFTVLKLSGSDWDPKRPNVCLPKQTGKIKALYLFLGPSTLTDVLEVETSDHARLELQLSYDWYFNIKPRDERDATECFSVQDFVGDCCSCIASRIRASVAGVTFDSFHRHSSTVVQGAVFGIDPMTKEMKKTLKFPSNRLIVTSVDVQGMSVLDEKTRVALQQSVKRAIQTTTDSQEAVARQDASVRQQQAQGLLDRQVIEDASAAERQRKTVIELETGSAAIASSGQAKAEAKARSDASVIETQSSVQLARVRAQTQTTQQKMATEGKRRKAELELEHRKRMEELDLEHKKALTTVESSKFGRTIEAMGQDTITALAKAGPDMQAKLLKSMGLQGYLVTDGSNPINLFNAAQGMTNAAGGPKP